ncbi:helix-turn-helix domain-containing protein [Niallia sp. JL1B1071]|uniref:helix-turn-helix domain-containing protein n=1 Tax=Niallia tiangongensis TaxID=3237105 RepID=UPI0037DBFE1D
MDNKVGQEIRRLRKSLSITQASLSEDICDQSMISKIEKGETYPSASILYQLSKKLDVEMEHFFRFSKIPKPDYVHHFYQLLRKAVQKNDYKNVEKLITKEEHHPVFKQPELQQVILWHKGMVSYYVYQNFQHAVDLLNQSLAISRKSYENFLLSERELEIINTLAVVHAEKEMFEKAHEYYMDAWNVLNRKWTLKDPTIYIRVIYNLAKVKTRLGDKENSIKLCKKGIDYCKEENLMYLLGELTYHIGYNYEVQTEDMEKCFAYYHKAITIFELQGNETHKKFISEKINKLSINLPTSNS